MKIKTSNNKIIIDNLPLMLLISAVVCAVLRGIQMAKLIDAETGFYKETSVITVLFYLFLFGSCLAFVVLSFLSSQSAKINLGNVKSTGLCIITSVLGISMLIDSAGSFLTALNSVGQASAGQGSAFKIMMATGELPKSLQGMFGLLSAVYFFFLASSFKSGNSNAAKHRILALAPTGWVAFRMIFLFVSKISFMRVSDLFLELCMLAFMIIFFMAFAQVASGVYKEGYEWRLPAFGLSAALIAAAVNIPRLIFTFVDPLSYINPNHTFSSIDLAFGFFAVALVIVVSAPKKSAENNTEAPTVQEEE